MLKFESIAKNIACEDTECIFPRVLLWIFCFGGYHVPNTSLSLLLIFLSRYLYGELGVCKRPLPNTAVLLMKLVLVDVHHVSCSPSLWTVTQQVVTSLWSVGWQPPAKSSSKLLQRWDAEGSRVWLLSSCRALPGDVSLDHPRVSKDPVSQELRCSGSTSFRPQRELYQRGESWSYLPLPFLTLSRNFYFLFFLLLFLVKTPPHSNALPHHLLSCMQASAPWWWLYPEGLYCFNKWFKSLLKILSSV